MLEFSSRSLWFEVHPVGLSGVQNLVLEQKEEAATDEFSDFFV